MTQQPNTPAPVEKAAPAYAVLLRAWDDYIGTDHDAVHPMFAAGFKAAQQAAQPVAGEPAEPLGWRVDWPGEGGQTWHQVFINEADALDKKLKHPGAMCYPLYTAAPAPVRLVPPGVWQPIETAPLNGDVLLLWWGGEVALGHWNPHNTHDAAWWPRGAWRGVGQTSKSMWVAPTHWMYPPHAPGNREAANGIKAGKDVAK